MKKIFIWYNRENKILSVVPNKEIQNISIFNFNCARFAVFSFTLIIVYPYYSLKSKIVLSDFAVIFFCVV